VVCVSGKAEIEGVAERVSAMKDGHEKIDLLLARNADEQLSKVDWNRLNSAISERLDRARQGKTSVIRFPTILKVAAVVAAAVAVLFGAVMIDFGDREGSAEVKIEGVSGRSRVTVDIGADKMLAKVSVQISDPGTAQKEDEIQPAWFIISRPTPMYADNGVSSDMRDVMCLF
jgi:hypothetical protein